MTNYIILLPPSEGKKEGGTGELFLQTRKEKEQNYFQELEETRENLYSFLLSHLKKLSESQLEKIFEVKEKNLEKALQNFKTLNDSSTLKAIERFDGVMFRFINFASFSEEEKRRFYSSVLFIDAFFGLLKAGDFIPNYKLKIGSKIDTVKLDLFWREKLKNILSRETKGKIIIDLLPEAHRKVLDDDSFEELIQISFLEVKGGVVKQAGHFSKELKGEFVRYLLQKEDLDLEYIKSFKHSKEYVFSIEHSSLDTKRKILAFFKK